MGRAWMGWVAGFIGTAAMSGTAITTRRLTEPPGHINKTHYEAVAEWTTDHLGISDPEENPLEQANRIRLGEAMHFGFGAAGGAALAALMKRRGREPGVGDGMLLATVMWLGAFAGYMPGLGITRGLWDFGNNERARTFFSHAAYGMTTALALRALRARADDRRG